MHFIKIDARSSARPARSVSAPRDGWHRARFPLLVCGDATTDAGIEGALATEFVVDLQPPEITDAVRQYAAPSFLPGRPLVEAVRELGGRIFGDFTYRSGSTMVSTQVDEVLAEREGCQHVAKLATACLRANGPAAS